MKYRIVPYIYEGDVWWSIQRKGWLFWHSMWSYCTEERARDALAKVQATQGKSSEPT